MPKKALIAMSGGVDSSVAAYLAEQAGYSCVGATMLLHPDGDSSKQVEDARSVAERLALPFHVLDFRKEFCLAISLCIVYNKHEH